MMNLRFVEAVRDNGFDAAIEAAIAQGRLLGITAVGEYHVLFAFTDKGFAVFREDEADQIDDVRLPDDVNYLKAYLDTQKGDLWDQIAVVDGDRAGIHFDSYFPENATDEIPAMENRLQ